MRTEGCTPFAETTLSKLTLRHFINSNVGGSKVSFVKIREEKYISKQKHKITKRIIVLRCDGEHESVVLFERPYEVAWLKRDLHFCCFDCANKSKSSGKLREKTKRACLDTYGVDAPAKSQSIKDKICQTNMEKYGVESTLELGEVKRKIEETNILRYGVSNPFANPTIQKKIKNTLQDKYGVNNPMQLQQFIDKIAQTKDERYGDPGFNNYEQIAKTMLDKHGVENPMMVQEFKDKIVETNNRLYGEASYTQTEEYKVRNRQAWDNKSPEELAKFSGDISARWEKLTDDDWVRINAKRHETNKLNNNYSKSHTEDLFFLHLCTIFDVDDIVRQAPVGNWSVDFYIKSIDTYVEFWGDYWHGRNQSVEALLGKAILHEQKMGKINSQYRMIANTVDKDKEKALYFKENGLQLMHIWESDFMNMPKESKGLARERV